MGLFRRKQPKAAPPCLPMLQTERLVLRCFEPSDAVDVFAYAQSPNVGPMAGWKPHQTIDESRAVVRCFITGGEVWAIVEKKSGRVIGSIGLHRDGKRSIAATRDLGYTLGESYWGQGYGTEACRAVLRYAFETLGCEVLSVGHFPTNHKSKRLIRKLGFTYEGTLRHAIRLPDDSVSDVLVYSMTLPEYQAIVSAPAKGRQEDKPCRH